MPSAGRLCAYKELRFYAKNKWQKVCIYAKKSVPLYIERWEVVFHLKLKFLNIMKTKRISLSQHEFQIICTALGDGMRARLELAKNCRSAAESGVQTKEKQEKWIEFANRAEREMQDISDLKEKLLNKMYE